MNFKSLVSKGLINLKDYLGHVSKGILSKLGLFKAKRTITSNAKILGRTPPVTSGARKKGKTPYYPGRRVSRSLKFKLTGAVQFPFNFVAFVLGKLQIKAKVVCGLSGIIRASTGLLTQIKGIRLFKTRVKVAFIAVLLTKIRTFYRIIGVKLFTFKQLWYVKGAVTFIHRLRNILVGKKQFRVFLKTGFYGVKKIIKTVRLDFVRNIRKVIKLSFKLRGKRDLTKILYILGLFDKKKS